MCCAVHIKKCPCNPYVSYTNEKLEAIGSFFGFNVDDGQDKKNSVLYDRIAARSDFYYF